MATRQTSTKTTSRRKTPVRKPATKAAKPAPTQVAPYVHDPSKGRLFVLDFPWEMRSAAGVLGAKWHDGVRAFTYIGHSLPPVLAPFASQDYSWERWREDDINGVVLPVAPSENRMKPRPHQMEAAKKIALYAKKGFRGFIEADNVGLGKTISTLVGAYGAAKVRGFTKDNPAKMLIICPKAVIPHWRNTLKSLGIDNLRVVVINYDQSKKLLSVPASAATAKRTRTKNKHIANSGESLVQWDIIIADESHKLKNIETSQRAKAFNRIARYAEDAQNAPFVIWASATIGQNPMELGYLAPLIGQMLGKKNMSISQWGAFLESNGFHVTKGKTGAYSWIKNDPNNPDPAIKAQQDQDIARLRHLLFNPNSPSIRRHPTDIAGWPEITRIPFAVTLDQKGRTLYEELWSSFRSFLRLTFRGRDPKGGLAQQLRFRQKASLLRVPGTVDFIHDLLDNNLQVAVSVEFMESLDAMREALETKGITCAEFSGRNVSEREQERLRFQHGQAQVIFFTVEEGISLHAGEQLPDGTLATSTGRATIVHDVRYSSLSNLQIEGRCHRDGQNANVYYMYADNTVEEKIIKRMLERMAHLKNLSGDDEISVQEIEALLDAEAAA